MNPFRSGDRGRNQASLLAADTFRGRRYGALALVPATVLEVRYPEQSGNYITTEITYDILFHAPRMRRGNVPRLNMMGGKDSGDEVVFTPSTNYGEIGLDGNISKLDGDVVLVGFINSSITLPIIVGAMTHAENTYKGSVATGQRRFMQHMGTTVEIDKTGNVTVVLKDTATFTLNASSATLEIPITRSTGDINVDGNVSVGGGATGSFVDVYGKIVTVLNGIVVGIT